MFNKKMFEYIKKFGNFTSALIGLLVIGLIIASVFYEGYPYSFAIIMFYLIFIGGALMYLGQKLGLGISKILFSLPTNFKTSWSESFIYSMLILAVLVGLLQISIVLPLLPTWIPFYEHAHRFLQNFVMISIAFIISQIIIACKYKIFTKG